MDAFVVSETNTHGDEPDHAEERPSQDGQREGRSEPENKFQRAISAWRGKLGLQTQRAVLTRAGVDLASLIPQLDAHAAEIVSNQKEALVERKEVAQKTKDFRKLDDNSKLSEIKSLLKCKFKSSYRCSSG